MSTYQTDDEQVEAIKKWWKENGRSVIGGVVLGFALIGGWKGYQGYQQNQGEAASLYFDAMRQAVHEGQADKALEAGQRLLGEYDNTAYASLAALEMAKLAYQRSEKSVARRHLQWVAESASDPALRELAKLRLGALLLDINELDALDALLQDSHLPAFAGEFSALRGDLEAARGNRDAAQQAYQDALAKGVDDEALLRMKLVDIGASPSAT